MLYCRRLRVLAVGGANHVLVIAVHTSNDRALRHFTAPLNGVRVLRAAVAPFHEARGIRCHQAPGIWIRHHEAPGCRQALVSISSRFC